MVGEPITSSSALNSDGEDTISTSSEDEKHCDDAVVLRSDDDNQEVPSFGNISVINSNEVHFGNKTFYHGPVTIKQFLYANSSGELKGEIHSVCCNGNSDRTNNAKHGHDNPVFESEVVTSKISDDSRIKCTQQPDNLTALQRFQKVIQKNKIILVSLLSILLISLMVLTAVMVAKHAAAAKNYSTNPSNIDDEEDKNTPIISPVGPNDTLVLSNKVKIVSRLEWLAQPPIHPANLLKTPVPYVIIHHTATENCSSQAQCIFQVRNIQTFHIESRGWWDIGYNFLVGGDGEAYEGRGWQSEGAHSFGYNVKSIGIAFIGTFIRDKPIDRQIVACKRLIDLGVAKGFIEKDYKVLAAQQLQTTQSPGRALYDEIKTWEHWSSTP